MVAAATVCMLVVASSEAAATAVARDMVAEAPEVSWFAVSPMLDEAPDTLLTIPSTAPSNLVVLASRPSIVAFIASVASLMSREAPSSAPPRPAGRMSR